MYGGHVQEENSRVVRKAEGFVKTGWFNTLHQDIACCI